MPPRLPTNHFNVATIACSSRGTTSQFALRQIQTSAASASASHHLHRTTSRNTSRPSASWSPVDIPGQKRCFHVTMPSAASKDPYKVLGVPKDASAADIKSAYFALARKFHPDTNKDPTAKDKFVEIQAAYDVIGDKEKKAQYDRFGEASQQQGFDPNAFSRGGNPFASGGFPFGGFGGGPFGGQSQADLFETLFGGAFGARGARGGRGRGFGDVGMDFSGQDIETSTTISFMDAAKGSKKSVSVSPVVDCDTCTGTGLKAGAKRQTCKACGGSGTRTFVVDSGFHMASTCAVCSGTGSTVPKSSQCGVCDGLGKVKVRKTVDVEIPAGVEDGMVIRIPAQGDMPIQGKGKAGDLLVRVKVTPSKVFRRQGNNLFHDVRVPFHSAILGGRVRVPTLDGDVEIRIPSGTQPGEECVLKGGGVKSVYGTDKGDLFIAFNITTPRTITQRQREILQEYVDEVEGKFKVKKAEKDLPKKSEKTARSDSESTTDPSTEQQTERGSTPHGTTSSDSSPNSGPSVSEKDEGWLGWASRKLKRLF